MKKSIVIHGFLSLAILFLSSCVENFSPIVEIDAEAAKSSYPKSITVSPMNESVTITKKEIIIQPKSEGQVYTISGYFCGQIKVASKKAVIKLNNAYLENTSGKPAILAKSKIEISSTQDSLNYIVSWGRSFLKKGAIEAEKDLVLGGSGSIFIKGSVCHAVEAEDVKIKGSGIFYLEGTKRGSALTCDKLEVEEGKTFSAYFLNSKNGIKAEESISIGSGNFHIYSNNVALKINGKKNLSDEKEKIRLPGGKFYLKENNVLGVPDVEF